jgi:hypothetical protein
MKCRQWSFAVSLVAAVLLTSSIGRVDARDANAAFDSLAVAQTAKHQCLNTCRARYRDCRHLKQLSSSECRGVYQDCARYTCSGLGPG